MSECYFDNQFSGIKSNPIVLCLKWQGRLSVKRGMLGEQNKTPSK